MRKFPFINQHDQSDCGPACLSMLMRFYGKKYTLQTLREKCALNHEGVSMLGISKAAHSLGFKTYGVKISLEQLRTNQSLPCIAHWQNDHFVVIYKITRKYVYIADPGYGLIKIKEEEFLQNWLSKNESDNNGFCLLFEPTEKLYSLENEDKQNIALRFISSLIKKYSKQLIFLFVILLFASFIQLIFPILTRIIFDFGIAYDNLQLIYLLLIAQLILFLSKASADFLRAWILLFLSTRINITIISDFLSKLMKLSMNFFDTKLIGDLLQRIDDHHRIEEFLSSSMLNVLFSIFNFLIFGIILFSFNAMIFVLYFVGTLCYIIWLLLFVKKRSYIDYKQFTFQAKSAGKIIEIFDGIEEIKLNNCEKKKRLDWEKIQIKLFKTSMQSLKLHQYQEIGSSVINEIKNILITFLAAYLVITGNITIGTMLSIQYILGQLNGPMELLVYFFNSAQDGKISFNRLIDIQYNKNEIVPDLKIKTTQNCEDIKIEDLSFAYQGPRLIPVLQNINLVIPAGKVTAIVGTSGSGKTTLIKLLLGFYEPLSGSIYVGNNNLNNLNKSTWRDRCGAVMQQGYIFSDTVSGNIALCDTETDPQRLQQAMTISQVDDFIQPLPLKEFTRIGPEGKELSQGQKQRILIARAVYSNPDYIFFDEATNALDTKNEKAVIEGLNTFYKGRTVVVIAHRLSTVKNADKIVVLDHGEIKESGKHEELIEQKGFYYHLIKNQLELEK